MKCVNCEKDIADGLEQCPHCGCHYPEVMKKRETQSQMSPSEIDKSANAKSVKALIDAAAVKGWVSESERKIILDTAKTYKLDPAITELMLNSAIEKSKQQIAAAAAVRAKHEEMEVKSAFQPKKEIAEEKSPVSVASSEQKKEEEKFSSQPLKQVVKEEKSISTEGGNGGVAQNIKRFCRKCGRPIKPGAKFCGGCGEPI